MRFPQGVNLVHFQNLAARGLADREAELLPVPYFRVVYTLPSRLRDIAYQNKRSSYDLLMKAAAETTLTTPKSPSASMRREQPKRGENIGPGKDF